MATKVPLILALTHVTEPVPVGMAAEHLAMDIDQLESLLADEGIEVEMHDGVRAVSPEPLRVFLAQHRVG